MLGNPAIAAFVAHHDLLYADLGDPVALLRGEAETRLSRFWPYASADRPAAREAVERRARRRSYGAYSELMSQTQTLVAEDILDAYPFAPAPAAPRRRRRRRRFCSLRRRTARPHLELTLFDLPPVAARARAKLAALGLSGRVDATGGDCFSDPLPRGADVVSLVRVLHDHDDESALVLLAAAHDALPPGGAVVVAEPMAGERGAEPMGDAYFGFYLLAMGRGRPRSSGEIATLLGKAGFGRARVLKTRNPLLVSALAARRV